MSDFGKDVRDLREKTDFPRRQFLEVDLQTCFIAIERAHLELSLGNTHEARKELAVATRGADTIERFLRDVEGEKGELERKLRDLRGSLESLRSELDGPPQSGGDS
jgi:hypothetical protein